MKEQLPLAVRLRAASTFDSFEVGENGALLSALVAGATTARLPPLWLWSGFGQGRSHLLQATCSRATHVGRRACYLPLAESWPQPEMLAGLEALDVVCVDDIQVVLGQAEWERALFRLYNDVLEQGHQLVISASAAPANLSVALPDLASRLAACVIWQIKPLNDVEQGNALSARARVLGIEWSEDTLQYLQRRLPRDMTSLFKALEQLDAAALSHQRKLTVPFVRSVLETWVGSSADKQSP
jgi:DnaA family protein